MELFRLLGTIAVENDKANSAIDETTGKAKQSESKINAAFEKIGGVVATAFAVDKIKDFGVACVENAAEVKAANSQFEQTFGELQNKAGAAIDKIAEKSGILATRLNGTATSIYAFAKSSGADSAEAMELMEISLQAAADSAAYYDTSLEQAGETLMSFLKGNFANDAALGVSCTEFTRNAKAAELFGKKYNELSEIQKQQTLLKMVTDSQELSGAMGQAEREADGFENVMGNLKESWKKFQAAVGMPALKLVVPIIQKATTGIAGLGEKVGAFIGFMEDGENRASLFKKALDSMFSPEFQSEFEEYTTKYFPKLIDQLKNTVFSSFTGQLQKLKDALSNAKTILQPLAEVILSKMIDSLFNLGTYMRDMVIPWFGFLTNALLDVTNAILGAIHPAITVIHDSFYNLMGIINEALYDYILPLGETFIEMLQQIWVENQDKITKIGELFETTFKLISGIVQWFVGIVESYLYPVFIWLVNLVQSNMGQIQAIFQSVFDVIGGIIDFFIALFTGNWQGMWDAVLSIFDLAGELLKNGFVLIQTFIVEILNVIWSKVVEIWENIKISISTKISSIVSTVSGKFEEVKNSITSKINAAKDAVHDAIEKIKGFFNFEFKWPHIPLPHFSISPSGWKVGDLLDGVIPSFGIQWYAKGGVLEEPTAFGINGNKLMVGGEAGPEAVAPIDVLQKYIEESVAAQNTGLVDILQKILAAILSNNEEMKDKFIEALEEMRFDINNREFARLVKAVN